MHHSALLWKLAYNSVWHHYLTAQTTFKTGSLLETSYSGCNFRTDCFNEVNKCVLTGKKKLFFCWLLITYFHGSIFKIPVINMSLTSRITAYHRVNNTGLTQILHRNTCNPSPVHWLYFFKLKNMYTIFHFWSPLLSPHINIHLRDIINERKRSLTIDPFR